jgi:hypothetical protein
MAGQAFTISFKGIRKFTGFRKMPGITNLFQGNLSSKRYDTLAGQENISLLPVHGQWNPQTLYVICIHHIFPDG